MKQIFTFGSSNVYGVGGTKGGWADLIKSKVHEIMYGTNGVGEKFEVFNFGKSGAKIDFVQNLYTKMLEIYGRDCEKMALVNVGGNNLKAEDEPDNFVSTPEEYKEELKLLLSNMKKDFTKVVFIEGGFYDETKVYPKQNPFGGGKAYFSNERKRIFSKISNEVCDEIGVKYVPMKATQEEWLQKYVYEDGLHANSDGQEYIFINAWKHVEEFLDL